MNAFQKTILHVFDEHVFGAMRTELDWALRGTATNLAALGLVTYTEFLVGIVPGDFGCKGFNASNFRAFCLTLVQTMRNWRDDVSTSTSVSDAVSHTSTLSKARRPFGLTRLGLAESSQARTVPPTSLSLFTVITYSMAPGNSATRFLRIRPVPPSHRPRRR
jgi:hypothetical protein